MIKLRSFKILIFAYALTICGCIGNQKALLEKNIEAPVAIIPLPASAIDFGTSHINESPLTERTITLQFDGGHRAEEITAIITGSYAFKGGVYPGTGGDCSTTHDRGTCTMVVVYSPTTITTHIGQISISFYNGNFVDTKLIDLTGITEENLLISDAPTYNIGNQLIGLSTNAILTVTNRGTSNMTGIARTAPISNYTFTGGNYPGTAGTCGDPITPGQVCNIQINFAPTVAGTITDNITLTYNNGINSETVNRPLTGVGLNPALLTIQGAPTYNFGNIVQTVSSAVLLTVTNSGDVNATGLVSGGLATVPYTFTGGTYPGGGTCGATITPGTCTIGITYTPNTAAVHADTVTLDYNDGVAAQTATRNITGTGVAPAVLAISEVNPYNYGNQVLTTTTNKLFTITNSGGANATLVAETTLAAPFVFAGGAFPGTGGDCTTSIANGTCSIVVAYTPTTAAIHAGTITLTYNDGAAAQVVSRTLSGTGVNPAALSIGAMPYSYGTVFKGTTNTQIFVVTNSGDVSATAVTGTGLAAPFSFEGGTYPGTTGNCGNPILVGACNIAVTYNSASAGSHSDTVILNYNDGTGAQSATGAISGTSQNPALLSISGGASYDFGSHLLTSSTDVTFVVTNSGQVPATAIVGGGIAGNFDWKGGTGYPGLPGGDCANPIPVGTCNIVVTYTPTTAAFHSDTITIDYNDGQVARQATQPLTGTGQNPASIAISEAEPYNYGTYVIGTSTPHIFTVTNSGDVPATGVTGTGLADDFSYTGGSYPGGGTCSNPIPVGACTISVSYAPLTPVAHSKIIEINYNNGLALVQATRTVQGTGQSPAYLTISLGPQFDFGSHSQLTNTDQIFNVTNTGGVAATAVTGSAIASDFDWRGGGGYPGLPGGTCGSPINIAPGGDCTIEVTYTPTTIAVHNSTIQLNYNNGAGVTTATRSITGTGTVKKSLAFLDQLEFDFDQLPKDQENKKTFKLKNFSEKNIGPLSLQVTDDSFEIVNSDCPEYLFSQELCSIQVLFKKQHEKAVKARLEAYFLEQKYRTYSSKKMKGSGEKVLKPNGL